MEKICYCNIIRILYVVQRQKRIFFAVSFSLVIALNLFFLWTVLFKRLTTSSAKATSTKLGTRSRTKGSWTRSMTAVDLMREFANFWVESFWKTTWDLCLMGNFPEREAKRASFSHLAPHLPSVGRGSLTQMKAVNTSSYSIFLREINYAHDLIKLFLLLLIE